jgi:hypothetical protein
MAESSQAIYGKNANPDDFSDFEDDEFKFKTLVEREFFELNRSLSSTEDLTFQHGEALKDIASVMRTLQDSQREMQNTLTRMLVRFRKHAHDKQKIEELTRCNKELAQVLSKKLYASEFKRKKIPFDEETMEGVIHPSALPYVYIDIHSDEEETVKPSGR